MRRAFGESWVNISQAWCSSSIPPRNLLEQIRDENGDGGLVDDLELPLERRGLIQCP